MDKESNQKVNRLGLALSGGGYRAAAFHLGTLKKLHEMGVLDKVNVISSISGGSIVAAAYSLHKGNFESFEKEFQEKLKKGVIPRILFSWRILPQLIILTLLLLACIILPIFYPNIHPVVPIGVLFFVIFILLMFQYAIFPLSKAIEDQYNRIFFKNSFLSELNTDKVYAIGSTNLETSRPFTFSQNKMGDSKYLKSYGIDYESKAFPVARAVMASSAVPFAFTPVLIKKKFYQNHNDYKKVKPRLVDGGVYDNQGVHKITHKGSSYYCEVVIVSNAGNELPFKNRFTNTLTLLIRTADVFMDRIRKLQMMDHLYDKDGPTQEITYLSLGWSLKDSMKHFVDNIKNGHLLHSVLNAHNITTEKIQNEQWDEIKNEVSEKVGVAELLEKVSSSQLKIARSVATNLTKLNDEKIEALMNHASLMTELHVKLYCPSIL